MVEPRGVEPLTSAVRLQRSPNPSPSAPPKRSLVPNLLRRVRPLDRATQARARELIPRSHCDTSVTDGCSALALLHQNKEGTGGRGGCLCIVLSGLQIFSGKCSLLVAGIMLEFGDGVLLGQKSRGRVNDTILPERVRPSGEKYQIAHF